MKNYQPNYDKCFDSRKIIYHGICKHCIKNEVMLCNLHNNHICCAWEGYIYEGYLDKSLNAKTPSEERA